MNYSNGNDERVGHTWLAHGLLGATREVKLYNGLGKLMSIRNETQWYILCNWGWTGKDDGYYLSGVFDATSGTGRLNNEDTRTENVGGGKDFIYNLSMIYGIRK